MELHELFQQIQHNINMIQACLDGMSCFSKTDSKLLLETAVKRARETESLLNDALNTDIIAKELDNRTKELEEQLNLLLTDIEAAGV